MTCSVSFIGFGEAAQAFAPGLSADLAGYDYKTDDPTLRADKLAEFAAAGVAAREDARSALSDAQAVLCLVTADQALAAASAAQGLGSGALWFDMNSVAPTTKRQAAAAIEALGGRYVDVAVMAPVHPKRTAVPLLVSGPHAADGAALLRTLGFTSVQQMDGPVGAASAVKMIRSVMIKGIEALSAECVLAAEAAGVRDAVIASLDASSPGADWGARFEYNLDRMIVHGNRRAAEMEEVVLTLEGVGVDPAMSRGTVEWQRAIGGLGLASAEGLDAKLDAIIAARRIGAEQSA